MSASHLAQRAYGAAARPLQTARGTEYQVFAEVTAALMRAAPTGDTAGPAPSFPALADAVARNRKLWSVLALDVASPQNGLPEALRARLFYLAQFVEQHSRAVLKGEDATPLIDVNRAVMAGLRPAATAEPGAAA